MSEHMKAVILREIKEHECVTYDTLERVCSMEVEDAGWREFATTINKLEDDGLVEYDLENLWYTKGVDEPNAKDIDPFWLGRGGV